jgi:NAD(P)H-hydrate epimerase
MGVPILEAGSPPTDAPPDLIVDGLVGYSLRGPPRGRVAELVQAALSADAPVLALDVPSGVDTTSGERFEPAVQAVATLTLALPKEGLRSAAASAAVGELYLADISVPPSLYASSALSLMVTSPFDRSDIVRVVQPAASSGTGLG